MSDFISGFWSHYVTFISLASIAACALLLWITNRTRAPAGGDNTTGHVWDEDLRELNNPLPRWWMWLFVLTVVFALAYLVFYPGLGSRAGSLEWSSQGQWQAEQQQARLVMAPVYAGFANMDTAALSRDGKAMGIGERLFANNCAQCHGADARGSKGFPNLTDKDWLWGGTPEAITETILHGRQGNMPPMAAAVGTSDDVRNLANYVLSLSGSPNNAIAAQLGRDKFGACAACHGPRGQGNPALGTPNLTDKVWLHGWGEDAIVAMVNNGKHNVMPAHEARFTPEQVKVLAAYVWGLSRRDELASR